jgi:hypothetical protein
MRARKRASFVTEKLALDKLSRQSRYVDCDERPRPPRTLIVQRPSDEFLARPAFPGDEHRESMLGESPNLVRQSAHHHGRPRDSR